MSIRNNLFHKEYITTHCYTSHNNQFYLKFDYNDLIYINFVFSNNSKNCCLKYYKNFDQFDKNDFYNLSISNSIILHIYYQL